MVKYGVKCQNKNIILLPSLLKIDVQGFEMDVLIGCNELNFTSFWAFLQILRG